MMKKTITSDGSEAVGLLVGPGETLEECFEKRNQNTKSNCGL